MRAKLGGRYAKYAKISASPEKSHSKITSGINLENVGVSNVNSAKKERNICGNNGRI